MRAFSQAVFLASAGKPADLLTAGPLELAFAGRSNVGKSSAINSLTQRKRLAYTSKTPGRTQTINFFSLGENARLVDLPGYGYARVSRSVRAQWEALIGAYLESRSALTAAVVLMDARHPLTPLDVQLLDWLEAQRILVLLSKCDKLTRRDQASTLRQVSDALAGRAVEVRLFSSLTGQGVEECRDLLEAWLANDASLANKKPPVKGI
jgi:GTP-binding protein